MSRKVETASRFEGYSDEGVVHNLTTASHDIGVFNGQLKWAMGIALAGESIRFLKKDSRWAKRISYGTRVVSTVLAGAALLLRTDPAERENEAAKTAALRYGSSYHKGLTTRINELEKQGNKGAIKVGRMVDARIEMEF